MNSWVVHPDRFSRAYHVAYVSPTGLAYSPPVNTLAEAETILRMLQQTIAYSELLAIDKDWQTSAEGKEQRFGQYLCNKKNWTNSKLFYAVSVHPNDDFLEYDIIVIY